MQRKEINLPKSFSRHTTNLCTGMKIYSLEDLIVYLKLGKRIRNLTRSSKRSYDEIFNALPPKIRRDYLNRSIDIAKHYSIDYALSQGDQELFFQYKIDHSSKYLFAQYQIHSFKEFMTFIKKGNRISDMLGAKNYSETSMFSLMPEHVRGWYVRYHVLEIKQSFSKLHPETDCIDHDFLSALTPRAKNLAFNYGLYNRSHVEAVFRNGINLGSLHGMGKTTVQEFEKLILENYHQDN